MDHVGAVHLMGPDQAGGIGPDRPCGPRAVLQHVVAGILARQAAIEAGERAGGDAAAAREEAVCNRQLRGVHEFGSDGHAGPLVPRGRPSIVERRAVKAAPTRFRRQPADRGRGSSARCAPPTLKTTSEEGRRLDDHATPRSAPTGFLRSTRQLWVIAAALIVGVIGVASLDMRVQYQTAINSERRALAQLSRVLAEDASRSTMVADLVLRDVQSRITALGVRTPEQFRHDLAGEAIHDLLRMCVRDLSPASAI